MSSHYHLSDRELDDLEFEHRHTTDKRYANRVKTVYLLGKGWPQLLHRLGYVYKKPKLIPGKADADRQQAFVQQYQTLKAEKAQEDPLYFMMPPIRTT